MSDVTTAMVDIDSIVVEDGFNPRRDFDPDRLAELEASLRETGIVSALSVRDDGDGRYTLIAGERRLIAARSAGLSEVPVVVRSGADALAAAIAENLIRQDLDPIEEANALARLAKAESLSTHKALAARVGKSVNWVGERLRLLKLPDGAQAHIASGAVPVAAERALRAVAKVSPRIAECACELAAAGEVDGRDVIDRFGDVLVAVSRRQFDPQPTMIHLAGRVRLSALVEPGDRYDALAARARKTEDAYGYPVDADDPTLALGEQDLDAARAAGCLLEHTDDDAGWQTTRAFLTDRELAGDLAERIVERAERATAQRAERRPAAEGDSDDDDRQARRERLAQAREEAKAARTFNLALGQRLIARRGAKTRRTHALARAKAVAAVVLADNDTLPAAGLRLVLPQLQQVEVTQLKTTGASREKVTYADADECLAYLHARIDAAKSANEVLELLADALIAAQIADDREIARSRRARWWNHAGERATKLLADDIKAVKPRRSKQRD